MHSLLRNKAADAAFANPLISIARASLEHSPSSDPLLPATDAFVTSLCYLGSTSLSHVLSCIDRCKDRLLALGRGELITAKPDTTTEDGDNDVLEAQAEIIHGDGAAVKRQIIQSVVSYWHYHPGVAVSIVDKLLNYSILTPQSVIEWALMTGSSGLSDASAGPAEAEAAAVGAGSKLSEAYVYEMVASTVGKVTGRVRQIVAARTRGDIAEEHMPMLDETLERERADMRALLAAVRDAVGGVAAGAADGMLEADGQGPVDREDTQLRMQWGRRWAKVFERKALVEEGVVGEAAVLMAAEAAKKAAEEAKVKAAEAKVMEEEEVQMVDANGGEATNGDVANGDDEVL